MQQGRDDLNTPPATRAIPHRLNRRANRLMSSAITRLPHWLANVVLVRPTLLITWRRVFWMLSPTPERAKSPLIDTLHKEQLPGRTHERHQFIPSGPGRIGCYG